MSRILSTMLVGAVAAVSCAGLPEVAAASAPVARQQQLFGESWKMSVGDIAGAERVAFDDAQWRPVSLPRAQNEDQAFKVASLDQRDGVVWYRKHFVLPAGAAPFTGGKAFLVFEGARQAADVYVNGVRIGGHENGVSAFGADATAQLKPAPFDNVLAVRVDASWTYAERASGSPFQWNNKNFNANYGGINRPVRLHLMGDLHQTLPFYSSLGTTGIYIWADHFDIRSRRATVHAESQVRNDSNRARTFVYRILLRDVAGKPAGSFEAPAVTLAAGETRTVSAAAALRGLNFWSWGYGYLYAVTTSLVEEGRVIDEVITRTGFRKTEFRNGMIYLNDRVIQIHGYAQRSTNEWPALGPDVPPWVSDFSNELMVESNGNLVRWMHVTPARQDIDSCDRIGLMQALPAGDAESDATGRRWEQRVEVMRDSIVAFRNNPSILFYEGGNKGISDEHMVELKAVRDEFDPHGGRAIGAREMLSSKVAEYGGEMLYIDKSAGKPVWAMEYSRDEGARAFQDAFTPPFHVDSPDYNRNQDSHAAEDVRRWFDYWRQRPGSGERVSAGGVNIGFTDSNTHFRGDNNYRRSGEVDAMRLPKEGFFAHQVMWDGWVDVERPRTRLIGHWNYPPGTVKDVLVVSSAERVELKLNGQSLGFGTKSDGFLFTFPKVSWAPGELAAIGYDSRTRVASRDVRLTTGAPAFIRLTPRTGPAGWVADAVDLALIDVEVTDARGNRVPTAQNEIRFTVEGPAEWRGGIAQGDSSGRPYTDVPASAPVNIVTQAPPPKDGVTQYAGSARADDNYILSQRLPVEGGVNRVALRSSTVPGEVKLSASADGLKSAQVVLNIGAPPAPRHDGLLAGDALPVYLQRGPTPISPSFKTWRTPIKPAETLAGSNATAVNLAQDDDEATHWSSDGQLANAWIEWRLDHPQAVNEVELKLIGWRLRSYPLRITMDGVVVYEGVADKTLGYVTLPLKPVKGSRLRMTLTGPTVDRDAFGKIVEITGARAGMDTGAEQVSTGGALGIVEASLYRKP
jgi:beta-galactosidase